MVREYAARHAGGDMSAASTLPLPPPYHPHMRSVGVDTLRHKRMLRFYQGRAYKGRIHQITLSSLVSSPVHSTEAENLVPLEAQAPDITGCDESPADFATREMPKTSMITVPLRSHESSPLEMLPERVVHHVAEANTASPVPISISLLGELRVELQNADGVKRTVQLKRKRRGDSKYTERELLAYLASRKGEPVAREKLLESVFGYGLSEERYSMTNLTNQFNKATQFLRQDINKVAAELGISPLTVISSTHDEWRLLTEECRVVDLEEVERQYALTENVSGEAWLTPAVQAACQTLIDTYRGDFLEMYIEDIVREGSDDWVDNWMRQPYTQYRTKFFQALWYRAEFWRVKGDLENGTSEAERTLQCNFYELAAKLYQRYAFHVATRYTNESAMLFDLEIKEQISLGERAVRAGLEMYATTRNTQAGDMLYLSFARRMETLTQGQWRPRLDTVAAWKKVKEQTKSHRLTARVMSHATMGED